MSTKTTVGPATVSTRPNVHHLRDQLGILRASPVDGHLDGPLCARLVIFGPESPAEVREVLMIRHCREALVRKGEHVRTVLAEDPVSQEDEVPHGAAAMK